jgi:hypothetical protein
VSNLQRYLPGGIPGDKIVITMIFLGPQGSYPKASPMIPDDKKGITMTFLGPQGSSPNDDKNVITMASLGPSGPLDGLLDDKKVIMMTFLAPREASRKASPVARKLAR